MVADEPTDGRCNARVVDKIGLEIECSPDDSDESLELTDHYFDIARLEGPDGMVVDADADYQSVRKYLWEDFECVSVGVIDDSVEDDSPVDRLDDRLGDCEWVEVLNDFDVDDPDTTVDITTEADPVWFDIGEVIANTTNRTNDFQGFCERYEMNDPDTQRCYVHQGGGAPEGNANGMTHGFYIDRSKFYQELGQEDKQYIEALVDSWAESAPFDRDNNAMVDTLYRCAIDQLKAWRGNDEYLDDNGNIEGLVKEQEIFDDGEVKEIEDEQPINMAYSRLTSDVRQELKEIGVYDSPDAQQADATESLARQLSGLSDE